MRFFSVLKEAWINRDKLGDDNQSRELAAFLPAALEIQDSPPNPLVRWLSWGLLSLVIFGILWAYFGQVNIVASAEGKIIPSSRVKLIQPLEKSVVRAIFVSEGDYVNAGQALVELDRTITQADEKRLNRDLHSVEMLLSVNESLLKLLKSNKKTEISTFFNFDSIKAGLATEQEFSLHSRLFLQQWIQYKSQYQSLQSSLVKTQAEQDATSAMISKLDQTLPIITKRTLTLKNLFVKDFVSEMEYLESEQERIKTYQNLLAEKQRLKQLEASEMEVREQVNLHTAQTMTALLTGVAELQRQISSLEEELNKAREINAKQMLYAPVGGRVQELSISTVGGVVTDAQQLMLIVPDEEKFEVEVFLENKDIGFVHEGMSAEIKINTFPFTKYGVIEGVVSNVSNDATIDEQRGLIYRMQVTMATSTISVNGKMVKLIPGMAVTAEVQTGERRIIEFFLAPLLRHSEESLRER